MRRTTAALVLATGLLAAACSSAEEGTATAAGGSSTAAAPSSADGSSSAAAPSSSAAAAPADLESLLLGQEDLPAGYEVQPVDPAILSQFTEQLVGGAAGITVDPAACGTTNPFGDLGSVALLVGVNASNGLGVSEALAPSGEGLGALRETVGACASFTVTADESTGFPFTGTGRIEVQPDPEVDADEVLSYTTTTDLADPSGTGAPISTTQLATFATVGDLTVAVLGSSFGGAPIDAAVVNDLLAAAVAKVQAG